VYYDIDKNAQYNPPPNGQDSPISRKRIYIVDLGTSTRSAIGRADASLGSAMTNATGFFSALIDAPSRVISAAIKLDLLSNELIAVLTINATSNNKEIPLLRPVIVGCF
jgi:hypothetical protein